MKVSINYFLYSLKTSLSKPLIWISIGLLQAFYVICLIIIPLAQDVSPLTAWTTNLQLFSTIRISLNVKFVLTIVTPIYSCLLITYLFVNDIKDSSRLIFLSKPISKLMVYVIKILVSIAIMFVSIGISIIVCLFSMLLPSAKGDIGLYPNLIVSLILEATLCILVFNLLAIIISFFLNPTRILTFTMTIAVVFIVYNAFSPTFYKSTTDRIISNSSEPIQNFQYVAPNGDILNTYNINDKNTNFKDVWKKNNTEKVDIAVHSFDFVSQILSGYLVGQIYDQAKADASLSYINSNADYLYICDDKSIIQKNIDHHSFGLIPIYISEGQHYINKMSIICNDGAIAYYLNHDHSIMIMNYDELSSLSDEQKEKVNSFVDQAKQISVVSQFRNSLRFFMNNIREGDNNLDYYNYTSLKVYLTAIQYIQKQIWGDEGLLKDIFIQGPVKDHPDDWQNYLTSDMLNDIYNNGRYSYPGVVSFDSTKISQYKMCCDFYRDTFYTNQQYIGWNGEENSVVNVCQFNQADIGSYDIAKNTYDFHAEPILPPHIVLPIWFVIVTIGYIAAGFIFVRKDVA